MASPANDPLLGRTVAQRYRLISRLGAGSVASVYLARHVLIDRLGAIKIVDPERAEDPAWRERFLREARAVNRINHPNIVEISDFGEADGLLYLVMEYVPGESLTQILERGALGWRRAAAIGLQIASALGRAHQMGVVHRDLTPSNVLVVPRRDGGDLAKLTDFGAFAGDADPRGDLHALGALLFEAASGNLPPPGEVPRLSEHAPGTPRFFDEVVTTLLAPDPDDRPRDGFEAVDLLRRALDVPSTSVPPSSGPHSDPPGSPRLAPPGSLPPAAAPPSSPEAGSARARIAAAPLDRLADLCDRTLAVLEEHEGGAETGEHPLDEATHAAVDEARRLCVTVRAVSELVASDTRTLEAAAARGRAARAKLGKRLDDAAREHSRALGWAGTIAERSYQVEVRRLSGEHPIPAVEAMVWEQAALEQEEDRARERAARLVAEMAACQREIARHSERLEHEVRVMDACLEGRMGALRSLAADAAAAVEAAATLAGVPLSALAEAAAPG